MRIGAIATAIISVFMLAALAFADGAHTSNKWRIELDGSALKTGDIGSAFYFHPDTLAMAKGHGLDGFRMYFLGRGGVLGDVVTPSQGEAIDVVATIKSGIAEDDVAKNVRDAFAAKLNPERFTVEVDDGEDILIKKKDGQPDFALELLESDVRNVNIKIEGE